MKLIDNITNKTTNKYYIYLEWLRRSGITNMFGATPYLQEAFNLSRSQAKSILLEWMQNYNPDDYEENITIEDWKEN